MRIWIGLLAAPLLVGLAGAAEAETEGYRGRRAREFRRSERMAERLELTPDQVERLETVDAEFAGREREIAEQVRANREESRAALAAEEFSAEEVERLGEAMAGLAAERARLMTERQIAIRRILTADQYNELQAGRGRMEERIRRRPRGGPRGEALRKGRRIEPEPAE